MPWLFMVVFPCHWWDLLVLGSMEAFCSTTVCAQIVLGSENFIALHTRYKQFSQAVI